MVRNKIAVLDKKTIDQIAAGEVVERPVSVVKELVENAIDAGADAITVEIKEGGKSLIRVTDNGCGIEKEQLATAFLRHATSKLREPEELLSVRTLGFRGEALSSISAVSRVEMITKTKDSWIGTRYIMEGGQELSLDDVGAPDGTSIMVYQLFYNTPARKKFLKSDQTEAGYIGELIERLSLSHPAVSFCFISNGKEKIHTSGNGNLKDTIYQIYGKEITSHLFSVSYEDERYKISGFIGDATIARGNRSLQSFFIDERYVKSPLLAKALEDGYEGYLMQHQYPFCVLDLQTKENTVDINVHPTKQEVRFHDELEISGIITDIVKAHIHKKEDIKAITVEETFIQKNVPVPTVEVLEHRSEPVLSEEKPVSKKSDYKVEPFEKNRLIQLKEQIVSEIHKDTPYERKYQDFYTKMEASQSVTETYEQTTFLTEEAKKLHRIIGQVFDTYWLVEYDNKLYIIDQHAAHEKVLYEKMMAQLRQKTMTKQMISPPLIVSLSHMEQQALEMFLQEFAEIGFDIRSFGGREYAITAVPGNLYSIDYKRLFMDMLSSCMEQKRGQDSQLILEKIASMSCKAAVKGNQKLSREEVEQLIKDLLSLENPYHCPHGRPTIISLSQYELEKKFRRIV